MKKTPLLLLLLKVCVLGFLTSSLVGTQSVQAQHTPDGQAFILVSPINIISPSNITYTPQSLILNLTVQSFLDSSKANITIVYSIDGKTNATIETQSTPVPIGIQSYYLITGWANLPEMPEGSHNITVYGKYEFPTSHNNIGLDNRTVYFTVNDGSPPIISNLSLENKTYSQDNLSLDFTVDESTSWIGYCLDGQANVTVTENFTLTELSAGSHTLIVYATDEAGNMGASKIISFSVAVPFPTVIVATASGILVAVVASGLLLYFKKKYSARN